MALVPRLASAPVIPTSLPNTAAAYVSGASAISQLEAVMPVGRQTDRDANSYEEFDLERQFDQAPYAARRQRDRRIVSSLFVGSAQSFADAFALVERGTTTSSDDHKGLAFFRFGTDVYIANMHTVTDDLPKRGEEVSFMI